MAVLCPLTGINPPNVPPMSNTYYKFIITKKQKGEPATDWLICWSYREAVMQAHYRTKLDCGSPIEWGVRTVRCEHEPARLKWLRENPNATSNQIYNLAPSSSK